jgi:hypothetical protein
MLIALLLAAGAGAQGPAVTVQQVYPDKILYAPDEQITATVTLANQGATDQAVTVRCTAYAQVAEARPLGEQAITVPAGKSAAATVTFPAGDYRYGVELVAEVVQNGQVLARGSAAFQVAPRDQVNRVGFHGGYAGPPGYSQITQDTPDCLDRAIPLGAELMRQHYINIAEFFGWAPEAFHDLAPTQPEWWDGSGVYHNTLKATVRSLAEFHQRGIKGVAYVWGNGASGPPGREIAREHPEWLARNPDGGLEASFDVGFLDNWNKMTMANHGHTFTQFNFDMYDPAAAKFHAEGLVGLLRALPFDGCRYDAAVGLDWPEEWVDYTGGPLGRGEDEDALSARNVKIVYDIVHGAFPNFIFQHNIEYPGGSFRKMDQYYIAWASRGCAMQCENPREDFDNAALRDYITVQADASRKYGASCYIFPSSPWMIAPLDVVYHDVLTHAGGAHLWFALWDSSDKRFAEHSALVIPYRKFETRYSALLWDEKLRRVAAPTGLIDVTAPQELWWNQYVYRRDLGAGRVEYLVHLVNPPPGPTVCLQGLAPTEPVQNAQVTLTLPAGTKFTRAFLLNAPDLAAQPVQPVLDAPKLTVTVPSVAIWSTVIFDCQEGA